VLTRAQVKAPLPQPTPLRAHLLSLLPLWAVSAPCAAGCCRQCALLKVKLPMDAAVLAGVPVVAA
jgi:hypothetical protein